MVTSIRQTVHKTCFGPGWVALPLKLHGLVHRDRLPRACQRHLIHFAIERRCQGASLQPQMLICARLAVLG